MASSNAPSLSDFTGAERRVIARLRTPLAVQRFLNALDYNMEPPPGRATLRSFRGVVRRQTAHCLEAALSAAVILEQHGYPPLVISFESIDHLDHVIFVYRRERPLGIDRALARSGAARAQAGLRHAARARAQLRRSRMSTTPGASPATRSSTCGHARRLRLAAVGAQRLEGGAHAPRLSAPVDPQLRSAHRPAAAALREVQGAFRQEARLLPAHGTMDAAPGGIRS